MQCDPMLSRSALPAERIVAAFHELRDKYPDEFPPQPEHWLESHRKRALEARLEHRWAAATPTSSWTPWLTNRW